MTETEPRLDIQTVFDEIRANYEADRRQKSFNAMVIGDFGSGKTHLLKTCRLPVLIHSFDPGGTKTLKDEIDKGWVLADTRYEQEDRYHPTIFKFWNDEVDRQRQAGMFEQLGTFVIDSVTGLSEAIMNYILFGKTVSTNPDGRFPEFRDWALCKRFIRDAAYELCNLPCDFLMTAHLRYDTDEATNIILATPHLPGNERERTPPIFDEVYVMRMIGGKRFLLTEHEGIYRAKTRIGRNGLFDKHEVPDIKALLKKGGYPTDDKPLFKNAETPVIDL